MDLYSVEVELKKRLVYPYKWHRKQSDQIDNLTNFVYRTENFDDLLEQIEVKFKGNQSYNEIFDYALNRWYNFWSAMAVEYIFSTSPRVIPAKDRTNRLVDFQIDGINFDHKTSVFPEKYPQTLENAIKDPASLINWLYGNQSQERRKHLQNRLFIVLYSKNRSHWKLKSELSWMQGIIGKYLQDFSANKLYEFHLDSRFVTFSDIIWGIK